MVVKTEWDLRYLIEEILRDVKVVAVVENGTLPHKDGRRILRHENWCHVDYNGKSVRVQHFYGRKDMADWVSFSACVKPTLGSGLGELEQRTMDRMLRESGVNPKVSETHVEFKTDPNEDLLRKYIRAYFVADKKIADAAFDYGAKLRVLKID